MTSTATSAPHSAFTDPSDPRLCELEQWLARSGRIQNPVGLVPASADASFRRYFRVFDGENGPSYIVMDAPPQKEDTGPFVQISQQLDAIGLKVPRVLDADRERGFLLLSDLGNTTFLSAVTPDNADTLYRSALQTLVRFQAQGQALSQTLPPYDDALLDREMDLFSDWLLGEHLQRPLDGRDHQAWQKVKQTLAMSALAQPQVAVHRDYHSRNLMIGAALPDAPGVLDFQDAVRGPLTYDAVSLLRDCYVRWPLEAVHDWRRFYFLALVASGLQQRTDWDGFVRAFDLMGMQRHLKASGIFARLWHRDGKDGYLPDVPNTLQYLYEAAALYPDLPGMPWLLDLLENRVLPDCASLQEVG
ncbi:aminoglycoside phosphotransferase family protein [Hydrogenovibrio halophilus]|uniref:aminoglycoside phosphotransferase family protein n=1 Tax=Hydrogenovibrio halophilus TaxID=373391 RepID=UPI00036B0E1D|nr:phosphotransferase [Hydrogenovibrio halophilus]